MERFNRTLANLVRSYLQDCTDDWDVHIPILTSAYRSTVHPSTGFSPNYLMFGREVTTPVDLQFPAHTATYSDIPEYVSDLQSRFAACYQQAREKLRGASERQKKYHDTRIVQKSYKLGDAVMKKLPKGRKFD